MAGKRQKLRPFIWRGSPIGPAPSRLWVDPNYRNEQFHASNQRELAFLESVHSQGSPNAARAALDLCAVSEIPMPRWLAKAVHKAIAESGKGIPEDVFGFGNKRMLATWRKIWLAGRETAIREDIDDGFQWCIDHSYNVSKAEFIKYTAHRHKMTIKAVEKLYYGAKKVPTGTSKK